MLPGRYGIADKASGRVRKLAVEAVRWYRRFRGEFAKTRMVVKSTQGYRSRSAEPRPSEYATLLGHKYLRYANASCHVAAMTYCRYAATARAPGNHARAAIRPNTSRPGPVAPVIKARGGMFFAAVVRSRTPITSPTSSFPRSAIGASQRLDRKPLPSFHFFIAFGVAIEGTLKVSECNHKARPAVPEAKLENIMLDESP